MMVAPPSLYRLSLQRLAVLVDRQGLQGQSGQLPANKKSALDDLAGSVVEELLLQLLLVDGGGAWRDRWRPCLTPRLQCCPAAWDAALLRHMASRCPSLRRLWVLGCLHFRPEVLSALPAGVLTADFDGQLYFRGRAGPALRSLGTATAPATASAATSQRQPRQQPPPPWLVRAEALLRALSVEHQKVPDVKVQPGSTHLQLVELHLGEAQATAEHIKEALRLLPNLRLLRHYQLVTALYQLHAAPWKSGDRLPTYKLRNLDADFSHVVRCRMSPEPVLAPDALQLAVQLCPSATQLRVRFDPQTPHDVLAAVSGLAKLQLLSAVCVSSGQRAHLDFSDVAAVLEHHGDHLRTLELKVLEEVDVHQVVALCPRLEELVLSGCGNVVPPSCASWGCNARASKTAAALKPLTRLRLLFYADGDDFSWDHDVPQCFWRWTLLPAPGRSSHLEGIFLESPRFDADTKRMLTAAAAAHRVSHKSSMYPHLEVLSICRAPELTQDVVAALAGQDDAHSLRLVHLNQCDQLGLEAVKAAVHNAARVMVD